MCKGIFALSCFNASWTLQHVSPLHASSIPIWHCLLLSGRVKTVISCKCWSNGTWYEVSQVWRRDYTKPWKLPCTPPTKDAFFLKKSITGGSKWASKKRSQCFVPHLQDSKNHWLQWNLHLSNWTCKSQTQALEAYSVCGPHFFKIISTWNGSWPAGYWGGWVRDYAKPCKLPHIPPTKGASCEKFLLEIMPCPLSFFYTWTHEWMHPHTQFWGKQEIILIYLCIGKRHHMTHQKDGQLQIYIFIHHHHC